MTKPRPAVHDYSRSLAVLLGTWEYTDLPSLGAARNSYRRMTKLLTGPLCGWPPDRLLRLDSNSSPSDIHDQLIRALQPVADVALFYYVGHGQIGEGDQLCLTLSRTSTEFHRRHATSLTFSAVRHALLNCEATTKIVILDCCFSGQATQPSNSLAGVSAVREDLATTVADHAFGTGAYTMAAAGAYGTAEYETGGRHPETYFTKYLADLVEQGVPAEPAVLKLEPLFLRLRDSLASAHLPIPVRRNIDSGGDFVFARNAALTERQSDPQAETQSLRTATAGMPAATSLDGLGPPREPVSQRDESPPPAGKPLPVRRPSRRLPVLASVVLSVAALATVAGWLLTRSLEASGSSTTSAAYPFRQVRYGDGLAIERTWTLAGRNGTQFTEVIRAKNATASVLDVSFEEPAVPAAVPDLRSASFTPGPPKILDRGQVLQWHLQVPAKASITISYSANVPAGEISRSRLQSWAHEFTARARTLPEPARPEPVLPAARLRTLAIHPLKVHLILGQTKQLKLTGLLSDGQQAPASDLSDPVWRSDDPSAVTVNSSGKIKAVGDRRTRITVTIDGISVSIYVSVDVTGQSGQGPGGGTQAPRPVNSSTPTPTPTVVTSTPPPI